MEQRIEFVVQALQLDANISVLCKEHGISRSTGYRWLNRYHRSDSLLGIRELSRRPHSSPMRASSAVEREVISLRLTYDWGGKKIARLLFDRGIDISVSTVNRIIKRNGLIRPYRSHRPATKRFERDHSNQLWQMDFKGDYRLEQGICYPLSILDDHSRFAVGLYASSDQLGTTVYHNLLKTFECYGVPVAMLMDHGIPWWGNSNHHGLTRLSVMLIKQGIKLYFSGIRHPQTQGKVERFHRTLKHALWYRGEPKTLEGFSKALADFRQEYNHFRPHEALGMAVPAHRYQSGTKAYNPTPPEWEYPEGAVVKRLNKQGCFDYNRKRLFVCEALAEELVQIEHLDDKLLVRYRQMYIREIELKTGKSVSLIEPVSKT